MVEVKVLGTGCPKCKRLEQIAHEAIAASGVEANLVHVTDIDAIMAYPIVSTPGLVVNEELKASGRLPRKDEVITWLKEAK
jgi:small redox-active disulfide protein 2